MKAIRLFPALFLLATVSSCGFMRTPHKPFAEMENPAAPDYNELKFWAAHPAKRDSADLVPSPALKDGQANAQVDVFFIHPTTYWSNESWNGDACNGKQCEKTDKLAIKNQASAFNAAGQIYAPRYRQMVYGAFFEKDDRVSAKEAYVLAYEDIKRAFEHYLEKENHGRPIIIASHSQGSAHAIHLLRDYFDGKPLQEKLVAAYMPGWSVPADTFQTIQPCAAPSQTGCYASWCSYEWGSTPDEPEWYAGGVTVNPVTWRLDTLPSDQKEHLGTVMGDFKTIHPSVTEAKVHGGILWVKRPKVKGAWIIRSHNFHIADYNLFWLDVRNNAALRAETYLQSGK